MSIQINETFSKCLYLVFQILLLNIPYLSKAEDSPAEVLEISKILVLENANVVVGRDQLLLSNMTLVLEGKWIKKISSPQQAEYPVDAVVYDLAGKFIIPGLIESHNHARAIGSENPYTNALYCGITTIRDMGGDGAYLKALQAAVNEGQFTGPDIYFSALMGGKTLIQNDRRVRMATPEHYELGQAPWMREVGNETNIEKVITEAKDCGATGIKIYSHLSADLVQKLTKEALKQDIKVWAHALVSPATVEDVIKAGIHSISHASFILFPPEWDLRQHGTVTFDERQVEDERLNALFITMKRNGTFLDPNLTMTMRGLNTEIRDKKTLDLKKEMFFSVIRKAHNAGVKMVAGTDIFLPQKIGVFPELHQEIEMMVKKVGMKPIEAIEAATYNGAMLLGIDKTHGSVEPGKVANLVVLNGDPLVDITNTTEIHFVVKNGEIHKR